MDGGVSRSNSNSLKPQATDVMLDGQCGGKDKEVKQSTSMNKLHKKNTT